MNLLRLPVDILALLLEILLPDFEVVHAPQIVPQSMELKPTRLRQDTECSQGFRKLFRKLLSTINYIYSRQSSHGGDHREKKYVRQQEISLAKARCAALLSNKSCEETDENVGLWYLAQRHVFSFFSNKRSSCPLIYVVGKRHLCLLRARRIMFNAISTSPRKNLTYFHQTPMIKMMKNSLLLEYHER